MADDLTDRTLIYIWCGILSGLWVILAICIIIIFLKVRNIGEVPNGVPKVNKNPKARSVKGNDVYNFGSSGILPGEDLAKRGFSQHAPKSSKPDPDTEDAFYAEEFSYSTSPAPRAPSTNYNPQAGQNSNFIY